MTMVLPQDSLILLGPERLLIKLDRRRLEILDDEASQPEVRDNDRESILLECLP